MIALVGALLIQDGQAGARLGETYSFERRLTGCSFSFEVQRLGGLISVVLEDGIDTPIVELMFFPDLGKPHPVPIRALLMDGDENNSADQRPPRLDSAWEGSFAFKMGDRTASAIVYMIQGRTFSFSYTLAGGIESKASVSLTRYEAAQIGECLSRLTPGASYLP